MNFNLIKSGRNTPGNTNLSHEYPEKQEITINNFQQTLLNDKDLLYENFKLFQNFLEMNSSKLLSDQRSPNNQEVLASGRNLSSKNDIVLETSYNKNSDTWPKNNDNIQQELSGNDNNMLTFSNNNSNSASNQNKNLSSSQINNITINKIKKIQIDGNNYNFDDIPIKQNNTNFIDLLEKNLQNLTAEQVEKEEQIIKEKGVRRHTPTKIKKKIIQISKPTKEEKKYHYYNAEIVIQNDKENKKKSKSPEKTPLENKKEKKMLLRGTTNANFNVYNTNNINNLDKVLPAKSLSREKEKVNAEPEVEKERVNNFKKPKKNEIM